MSPAQQSRLHTAQIGMSLLEVLIALALTALLVTALNGTLALGGRAWERYGVQGAQASSKTLGIQALRALLEQIRPLPWTGPNGQRLSHIRGGPDWIVFTADPGPVSPVPGLRAYRMAMEPPETGSDQTALMLASGRPNHRDQGATLSQTASRSVLLGDVTAWRLSYQARPGAPWQDRWADGPDLPALIRIELVYNGATETLFVAPRRSRGAVTHDRTNRL